MDISAFIRNIRAAVHLEYPGYRNRSVESPAPGRWKEAAVLVAFFRGEEAVHVVLTERSPDLSNHPGQIAFPGGKMDAGETPSATALREAHEEIGLLPEDVDVLGYLDGELTISGFHVVPVVGWLENAPHLRAASKEVKTAFSVPVPVLFDRTQWQEYSYDIDGALRTYHSMHYGKYRIWGVTAAILLHLAERLQRIPEWT